MARCILLMTRVATDHNVGFTTCKRRALKDLAWKLAYLKRQVRSGGATGTPDATVRARANQRLAQGTMVSVLTWSLALRPVWSVLCLGRRVGSNDTSSIGWQAKSAEAAERYKMNHAQTATSVQTAGIMFVSATYLALPTPSSLHLAPHCRLRLEPIGPFVSALQTCRFQSKAPQARTATTLRSRRTPSAASSTNFPWPQKMD